MSRRFGRRRKRQLQKQVEFYRNVADNMRTDIDKAVALIDRLKFQVHTIAKDAANAALTEKYAQPAIRQIIDRLADHVAMKHGEEIASVAREIVTSAFHRDNKIKFLVDASPANASIKTYRGVIERAYWNMEVITDR